MGSQHSRGEDQSHPVDGGWCPEGFLHRQGWLHAQTNFFKANCWPTSENMKAVINTKYPYQIQQATAMLVARGVQDGEGSQQDARPHGRPPSPPSAPPSGSR